MSQNSEGQGGGVRQSGRRPSADYDEVIANGLGRPANDNGGFLSAKTKTVLKILIPVGILLALLALY